jgi:rod shape-determining protein MreC
MLRRPTYLLLAATVGLVLVLLNLPARTSEQIKLAIGGMFLPFFGVVGSAQQGTERAGNLVMPRSFLVGEIERLREENAQFRLQLEQMEAVGRENDRLRAHLGWQQQRRWKGRLARVTGRDPANWWRTIHIDLGSRDGLRENLPVVTPDGLVGRVGSVGYTRSQVVLVGDPNCHVAAVVVESRENGVVAPSTSPTLDPTIVDLSYLSRNSQLQPGQEVVTSGLGGVFPKDIPVGVIVDRRTVDYGLYTEARVKLHVNINRIEEVWVLFP